MEVLIERERLINVQAIITAPFIGITDFDVETIEFFVSLCLCGCAHPGLLINTLTESHLKVLHKMKHTLLGRFREIAFHIHLSHSHAQNAFHCANGTLPTRTILLRTRHHFAIEIEVSTTEIIAQSTSCIIKYLEFKIILQRFQRTLTPHFLHFVDGFELIDRNFCDGREILLQEISIPVETREITEQIIVAHLVVISLNITQLCARERSLCDACLDCQHILHLLCRISRRIANELKQLLDVFLIPFTDFHRRFIIIDIVISVAECDTTLVDLHQVHFGILNVGINPNLEEGRKPQTRQPRHRHEEFALVFCPIDSSQHRANWSCTFFVQAHTIHCQAIESTDFLRQRTLFRLLLCKIFDKREDALTIRLI